MKKCIIITEKYGDLGNRLFRFARFFSFLQKEKYHFIDLTLFQYSHLYNPENVVMRFLFFGLQLLNNKRLKKIESILSRSSKINIWGLLPDQEHGEAIPISALAQFMKTMKRQGVLFIKGSFFFSCDDVEEQVKEKLRAIFRLKSQYLKRAKQLLESRKIFSQKNKIVAVHVRQGDYEFFDGGKHYFKEEVYASCMRHLLTTAQERNLVFILITKEELDLKPFDGLPFYFFGKQSVGIDQALLQFADYIVSPKSTFSSWASFLYNIPRAVIRDKTIVPTWDEFSPATVNS